MSKRFFYSLICSAIFLLCGVIVWKTDAFMWFMIEHYQIPKYGHQNLLTYDEYKSLLAEAQTGDPEAIIRLFTFYEFGVYEKSKSDLWRMRGLELQIAYFLYQFGNEKFQTNPDTGYKYIRCAADSGYTAAKTAMGRLKLTEGNTGEALPYLREAGIDGSVNAMILLFDELISGSESDQVEAFFWITLANEISEKFDGGWKNRIDSRRQRCSSFHLGISKHEMQLLALRREKHMRKINSVESKHRRKGAFSAKSESCHFLVTQ